MNTFTVVAAIACMGFAAVLLFVFIVWGVRSSRRKTTMNAGCVYDDVLEKGLNPLDWEETETNLGNSFNTSFNFNPDIIEEEEEGDDPNEVVLTPVRTSALATKRARKMISRDREEAEKYNNELKSELEISENFNEAEEKEEEKEFDDLSDAITEYMNKYEVVLEDSPEAEIEVEAKKVEDDIFIPIAPVKAKREAKFITVVAVDKKNVFSHREGKGRVVPRTLYDFDTQQQIFNDRGGWKLMAGQRIVILLNVIISGDAKSLSFIPLTSDYLEYDSGIVPLSEFINSGSEVAVSCVVTKDTVMFDNCSIGELLIN